MHTSIYNYIKNLHPLHIAEQCSRWRKSIKQRNNYLLYISLTPEKLLITLYHRGRTKRSFKQLAKTETTIPPHYIMDNIIYNPSYVANAIAAFCDKHHLYKPRTIACFPNLASTPSNAQQLILLQILLCLAKKPIYLEALITNPLPTNKYNDISTATLTSYQNVLHPFTQYLSPRPEAWLTMTVLVVASIITILGICTEKLYQSNKQLKQREILFTKEHARRRLTQHQEQQQHAYHNLCQTLMHNANQRTQDIKFLLRTLSSLLPPSAHLTEVTLTAEESYNHDKKGINTHQQTASIHKQKKLSLNLHGITTSIDEASTYADLLRKSGRSLLADATLHHLTHTFSSQKAKQGYSFLITSSLELPNDAHNHLLSS